MRDEDLWDMSDDELEAAFKEAASSEESPETDLENETQEFNDTEDSNEEFNNGPEQPEDDIEDSGHDTSDDSDSEEVTEEDGESEDSKNLDEDLDEEDNLSSDETDDDEDEEQPVQTYKFRANGKDYEFTSDEIVDQFPKIFGQAMDYTKKMQTIKPWRKTIDAIESAKLNHDDVNLMIDVLKGNKDAIREVIKRTGVDTLDLDTESDSKYVAKDYGRNDSALAIKDIVEDISQDVEYATTHSILSKEWDDKSWSYMAETPEMIRLLHVDVKSGMYQTLQPIAEKLKVYDGAKKSDLDYYKEAAQQHFSNLAQQEAYDQRQAEKQARVKEQSKVASVKAKSEKQNVTKQASAKRKAAAPTRAAAGRDVIDYLEDSDEAFEEWYKKLQDSM